MIQVRSLSVHYGEIPVLHEVSLEVKAGDAAARRYGFTNDPVMLVLDANGLPLTQPLVGGHIEDKQFLTYIQSGIDR